MKLSQLSDAGAFALLGPGFTGGRFRLLCDLTEVLPTAAAAAEPTSPVLVHAPFETAGGTTQCFAARQSVECDLDLDVIDRPIVVTLNADDYRGKVEQIREAIAAGDVYQVCYTVRALVRLRGAVDVLSLSGSELFSRLCTGGVPRFAAWVRLPDGEEFVSASPELFFAIDGRRIRSEPMKGTSGRDSGGALEASEKDRAELAMITDLLRNDLTRVCRPRTVRVTCARRAIELPYAVQTVSDVTGELAPGATWLDALAALHPGGSVTGAPKGAALAVIRQLEESPRGAYCGALGLCEGDRAIFSLLIRTATRMATGWVYGVGSGIVWDSDPAAELTELDIKLGALRCATRCSD